MEKKTTKQETPPKAEPQKVEPKKTEAQKIWDIINNVTLDIFALPNQKVSDYFTPVPVEPSKLYLQYSVPAALPSLEETLLKRYYDGVLQKKFVVSTTDKYVVVSIEE